MSTSEFSLGEPVSLIAGNLDQPGAPILHLALLYDTELGTLNGKAQITQAVAPPNGRIVIRHVTGQVHGLGLGQATRAVALSGEYAQSLPPPAIGTFIEKFEATFVTDNKWRGHGTFSYGGHVVANVPVKPA